MAIISSHQPQNNPNMQIHEKRQSNPLPTWDLSDLYSSPECPKLKNDLQNAKELINTFSQQWQGKLNNLSGKELACTIQAYEQINEILGKISSYAQLIFATDSTQPKNTQFYQDIQEKITDLSTSFLFFTLELNQLDEKNLREKLKTQDLYPWKPFLDRIRILRPYQLSNEIEKLFHEKSVTGSSAWSRLYDETLAALQIPFQDQHISLGKALNKLSSSNSEERKQVAKGLGEVFNNNLKLFSLITNTLAKDKQISDQWHGFLRPDSQRNCNNQIEDEVVDALVQSVTHNYKNLSHRYYQLKAKWLGVDKLNHWDRNAPLPDDQDLEISWEEAKKIVFDAYNEFDPRLGKIIQEFLNHEWIDATLRPGKASGAFAHPTVPSVHPYILLNYYGRSRDVMTLAHELGHGIHQMLAAKQGYLLSDTPLTLAETASVFGEMLTFQSLLKKQIDLKKRRILLSHKVEDMLNTVVRQIAFYQFERKVHEARKENELLPEQIGQFWLDTQKESLGPAFEFTLDYNTYWTYIPHFIHAPFYVYAYAFGDCLVNALYSIYQEGYKNFQDNYIQMLQAGGTKNHKELLTPFGLDASDASFWQKGLNVINHFINELEKI